MPNNKTALRVGLPALFLAAVGALALAFAPSADAATTISIHQSQVPTRAKDFAHSCARIPGGKPLAGQDGWVFVLPDNGVDFLAVTATFTDLGGGVHTLSATVLSGAGTSKAYVLTPIGWTLTNASATVDGTPKKGFFNLTHTCPGTEGGPSTSPSPSRSTSPSTSTSPSGSTGPSTSPSGSAAPSVSVSPTGTTNAPTTATTPPGGLPITGNPLTGILLAGIGLAASGAMVLLLLRSRRAAFPGASPDQD